MSDIDRSFEFEADIAILETLIRDYWISKKKKDGEELLMYEDIVRQIHSMSFKYRMKIRLQGGDVIC